MSDSYETLKAQKDAIVARENRELDELRATFDLRYKADMRAIQRWQEATGKELTWPDHADLCVWLLDQLAACQRERERCAQIAENVKAPKSIGRDKGRHHEAGAQHAAAAIRDAAPEKS